MCVMCHELLARYSLTCDQILESTDALKIMDTSIVISITKSSVFPSC